MHTNRFILILKASGSIQLGGGVKKTMYQERNLLISLPHINHENPFGSDYLRDIARVAYNIAPIVE